MSVKPNDKEKLAQVIRVPQPNQPGAGRAPQPSQPGEEAAGALVVPEADDTHNQFERDVIGNKEDAAVSVPSTTASLMAYVKGLLTTIVPDLSGLAFQGTVSSVTTGSETTTFQVSELAGYGNDFFSDAGVYYIQIIKATNAIKAQTRKISDYISTTGGFVVSSAFGANVSVGDEIVIVHESLIVPGRDDADNIASTTNVVQNEDGSILERLEFIQKNLIPDVGWLTRGGTVSASHAAPTLNFVCSDLSGYGDDIFNTKYYAQVIKNADAVGTAPETEVRQITDYVSTSGTFTVYPAFSAAVSADDEIVIFHESLVLIGRNDADNTIDTSSAVPNLDGSLLERDQYMQEVLKANPVGPFNAVWFVDPNGSDTTGLGTWDAPFASVQQAISVAKAMDVVIVKPGKYSTSTTIVPGQVQIVGCGQCTNIEGSASPIIRNVGENASIRNMLLTQTGTGQIDGIDIRGTDNIIEGVRYKGYGKFITIPSTVAAYSENFDTMTPPALPERWYNESPIDPNYPAQRGLFETTATTYKSTPNCIIVQRSSTAWPRTGRGRVERDILTGESMTASFKQSAYDNQATINIQNTSGDQDYSKCPIRLRTSSNTLECENSGVWETVKSGLVADTWYDLKITVDIAAQTYDVYVDNMVTPLKTGVAFACESPQLVATHFGIGVASNAYLYLDDFGTTGALTPEYNLVKECDAELNADYEAFDVDADHNSFLRNKMTHTTISTNAVTVAGSSNYFEENLLNPTANVTTGFNSTGSNNTFVRNYYGRLVKNQIVDATADPIIIPNYLGRVASSRADPQGGDTASYFHITGGGDITLIDNFYNNMYMKFTSGANAGQQRLIKDFYYNIVLGTAITVYEAFDSIPAANDRFDIVDQYDNTQSEVASCVSEMLSVIGDPTAYGASTIAEHIEGVGSDVISELGAWYDNVYSEAISRIESSVEGGMFSDIASELSEMYSDLNSEISAVISEANSFLDSHLVSEIGSEVQSAFSDNNSDMTSYILANVETPLDSGILELSTMVLAANNSVLDTQSDLISHILANVETPLDSAALATSTQLSRVESATDQISSLYSYTQSHILGQVATPLDSAALNVSNLPSLIQSEITVTDNALDSTALVLNSLVESCAIIESTATSGYDDISAMVLAANNSVLDTQSDLISHILANVETPLDSGILELSTMVLAANNSVLDTQSDLISHILANVETPLDSAALNIENLPSLIQSEITVTDNALDSGILELSANMSESISILTSEVTVYQAQTGINRDLPSLTECFETEALDSNIWEETLDGAGTGAFETGSGYMYYALDTDAVQDDDVFINSKYRWQGNPAKFGDSDFNLNTLTIEFLARSTGTLTNVDNTHFFLGLISAKSNDITTNNLAGFVLVADALTSRTDVAGTDEDQTIGTPPTLTDWNKYKIVVYATGYKFYVNGVLKTTHTTQVPSVALYLVFGTRAETTEIVGLDVTNIRAYYTPLEA